MRRVPWLLLALAAAARAFGCWRTEIPGRDGFAYLWMAQQWAAGHLGGLFGTVFHPLYPFLVGILLRLWPGIDVALAGQLVSAGAATVAVLPLWWVAQRLFGERAAVWAGVMYAIGTWFVRHPAESMSEGPFYLLASAWAAAMLARRPAPAGVLAGLAFLTRPEGAALAVAGVLVLAVGREGWSALRHGIAALLVSALLPLGYAVLGHGFTLTPKASFNWEVGAGGSRSPLAHYFYEWSQLPGSGLEGLGYLVFPLMAAGAWRWRPRRLADPRWLLLLPFLMQCAVVPLLRSHFRFLSGFGVLLLPFAGAMFAWLWQRSPRVWWPALWLLLLVGSESRLWLDRHPDRSIERLVGQELGRRLRYGETLASDMPGLMFFAGQQPPPPAPITLADILSRARRADCRFVVLKMGRTALDSGDLAILGLEQEELPALLSVHVGAADLQLYARPDRR